MRHGIVATRLTCFALISAVEADLRQAIDTAIGRSGRATVLTPDVYKNATRRSKRSLCSGCGCDG